MRYWAVSRRRVLARCPRRCPPQGVHPALEIGHPLLRQPDVGARYCPGVLLQRVQEHHEILRALVQDPVASVREPDPKLAQLILNLRGDRERRRAFPYGLVVQVFRDEVIDLRGALGWQREDEFVNRRSARGSR